MSYTLRNALAFGLGFFFRIPLVKATTTYGFIILIMYRVIHLT